MRSLNLVNINYCPTGFSVRRILCVVAVVAGLLLSIAPQFFCDKKCKEEAAFTKHRSLLYRVGWPCVALLSMIPIGLMNAVLEKIMKEENVS